MYSGSISTLMQLEVKKWFAGYQFLEWFSTSYKYHCVHGIPLIYYAVSTEVLQSKLSHWEAIDLCKQKNSLVPVVILGPSHH